MSRSMAPQSDPRRARLVAHQPVDPCVMKRSCQRHTVTLLLARLAHDRGRADAVRRHQHDPHSPHMLLSAVPIRDDRLQTLSSRFDHQA
jgi:hypothetical protein